MVSLIFVFDISWSSSSKSEVFVQTIVQDVMVCRQYTVNSKSGSKD